MNFEAMVNIILAAGHSGQNKTVRRSSIKLSKIARYSASLEFFVAFPLPDLHEQLEMKWTWKESLIPLS